MRPDARRRRFQGQGDDHGRERWLVSYADFITLLFAFFVSMYAISTVDPAKLTAMRQGLKVAFDGPVGSPPAAGQPAAGSDGDVGPDADRPAAPSDPATSRIVPPAGRVQSTLEDISERLAATLAPAIAEGRVGLEPDRRGLVISIRESGTFTSGSADLLEPTRELLARIAAPLTDVGNLIRVEGHTDNVPINTARYASNWELSTARATAVVSFLVQSIGLDPARLSAAGYSEFHPQEPNDTPERRARNRRVDIVILNPVTARAEEPGQEPRP